MTNASAIHTRTAVMIADSFTAAAVANSIHSTRAERIRSQLSEGIAEIGGDQSRFGGVEFDAYW